MNESTKNFVSNVKTIANESKGFGKSFKTSFSILVLLDGLSSLNNFNQFKITDVENGEEIETGALHDLFCEIEVKKTKIYEMHEIQKGERK